MLLYLTVSEPNFSTTIIHTRAYSSMLSLLSSSISSSSPPSSSSPSPSSSTSSSSSSPIDDNTRHLLLPLADHRQEVPLPLVADAHLVLEKIINFHFAFVFIASMVCTVLYQFFAVFFYFVLQVFSCIFCSQFINLQRQDFVSFYSTVCTAKFP